jgi:hypothetical protein
MGLIRYAARTPLADRIEISHRDLSGTRQELSAQPEDDPWTLRPRKSSVGHSQQTGRLMLGRSTLG